MSACVCVSLRWSLLLVASAGSGRARRTGTREPRRRSRTTIGSSRQHVGGRHQPGLAFRRRDGDVAPDGQLAQIGTARPRRRARRHLQLHEQRDRTDRPRRVRRAARSSPVTSTSRPTCRSPPTSAATCATTRFRSPTRRTPWSAPRSARRARSSFYARPSALTIVRGLRLLRNEQERLFRAPARRLPRSPEHLHRSRVRGARRRLLQPGARRARISGGAHFGPVQLALSAGYLYDRVRKSGAYATARRARRVLRRWA